MSNKQNTKGYTTHVNLRFKQEEYSYLESIADKLGCTMSQAIRYILFDDKAGNPKQLDKKSIENSIINTRQNFKKIAGEYAKIATSLSEKLNAESTEGSDVRRMFKELEGMTLILQKSINEVLHLYGQQETHAVSRTKLPDDGKEKVVPVRVTKKDIENFKTLYCYMETIMIIGNLAEDATEYTKDGAKRMRFKVIVERRYDDAKEKVAYNVFTDKSPLFEHLKKGTWVHVFGTFSENRKTREKVIFPHEIHLNGAQ